MEEQRRSVGGLEHNERSTCDDKGVCLKQKPYVTHIQESYIQVHHTFPEHFIRNSCTLLIRAIIHEDTSLKANEASVNGHIKYQNGEKCDFSDFD